jgi:hypothetical protein
MLDAAAIVGLLANDDRRRCWAALELGSSTQEAVALATGLGIPAVAQALSRLVSGGLVVTGTNGGLFSLSAAFQMAAREALQRASSTEYDDLPAQARKVMNNYVLNGVIMQIPVQLSKRLVLLEWLAQEFEPGRRYSEKMVNLILAKRHPDTAAWRRYLVDEDFLSRDAGEYWRSGGSVST